MASEDPAVDEDDPPPAEAPRPRCDYCRLPIPGEPVETDYRGVTYRFCCPPCRDRLVAEDRVFTQFHGTRRFDPGVSALRAGLPQGIPRNSFILISGQAGTREEALYGELVWRALERGESAVVATFLDTPLSVVQGFVALGWNVLPYLADGQLQILDCFTYRLEDPEEVTHRMNDWNDHLRTVAGLSTEAVRDPSNPPSVLHGLENCLDDEVTEDTDDAVVVIDSLTEFGSLVQPVQAYDFVKDLRARVPKARSIPVFAGASRIESGEDFPHDLGYIADGVIDLALSDELVEDTLMKRIRVRKMSGVLSIRRWATYEFAEGRGLVAARRSDEADDDGASEANGDRADGTPDEESDAGSDGADSQTAAETAGGVTDGDGDDRRSPAPERPAPDRDASGDGADDP